VLPETSPCLHIKISDYKSTAAHIHYLHDCFSGRVPTATQFSHTVNLMTVFHGSLPAYVMSDMKHFDKTFDVVYFYTRQTCFMTQQFHQ